MSTPTIKLQQKWAAEVAHVANRALRCQGLGKSNQQCHKLCCIEAGSAISKGYLREAVLLFCTAYGADLMRVMARKDYRALPETPADARRRYQ